MANQNTNQNKSSDQKELELANSEILDLKETVEKLKEQNVQLEEDKKALQEEIAVLQNEVDEKVAEIDCMKEKVEKVHGTTHTGEPIVEIVAVPPNKMIVPKPKFVNGDRVRESVDEHGYYHYFLPQSNAAQIVADKSGMRHLLYGPVDFLKTKVRDGLYSKDVTLYRYSKRIMPDKSVQWIPAVKPNKEGTGE